MRTRFRAGLFAVAMATSLSLATPVLAAKAARPLVLHPRFALAGSEPAFTNGRYTFIPGALPGGTLVDEQTAKRTTLPSPPGCTLSWQGWSPLFGGSSLLYGCYSSLELYRVPLGPWQSIATSSTIATQCAATLSPGTCHPIAVGSDWIEFELQCYHCTVMYLFQNIATGQVARDPTNGDTIPDLNSPSLARHVCRPVSVPYPGAAFFEGGFVVTYDPSSGTYLLQRCGRSMTELLGRGMAEFGANGHVLLWGPSGVGRTGPYRLFGMFLPSRRRFTIPIPRAMFSYVSSIAVSSRHLYVYGWPLGGNGRLWSTAVPSEPAAPR